MSSVKILLLSQIKIIFNKIYLLQTKQAKDFKDTIICLALLHYKKAL